MKNYYVIPLGELINNRFKYLLISLTSFKNLMLIGVTTLYLIDGLESWPFVTFAAFVLGARELKECLIAWRGNGKAE